MTSDDIIRMAREAGLPLAWISNTGVIQWAQLEHFAALVAAAEREAVLELVDGYAKSNTDLRDAIRARGK